MLFNMPDMNLDRQKTLEMMNVSRETSIALDKYVTLLEHWNKTSNLIGKSTLSSIWSRHILDSAQAVFHKPEGAMNWLDLGSGAGLPGIVIAILTQGTASKVHLVESNAKKCAFLHRVTYELGLNVTIHAQRIESVVPKLVSCVDVVTARALAPLSVLLDMCEPLWLSGKTALFYKGQDVGVELTEATKSWRIEHSLIPSLVSKDGCIVCIESAERR
jgi:16S rRNA (guanine527-N7)-methyltransferase